ncbi:anti-sigma regulatory factor [Rhizocola hellebori]|uniref:Anti-sigma regulatory factor n=1 Tax=Rhizocola hellebori TaxID=1392758 RepID=A0A8J3VLZ2_9ACTN|nr:anti-sigma factor RsbA family regulatory protein [Rhizocola hellebori]GIH10678.1 anti-sigma regulatory factor [Rhizocola hellebori]
MRSAPSAMPAPQFDHPALFYRDQQDYLVTTVPFILDGLEAGDPVMVSVPTSNLACLREALGDDARRVIMHDMTVAGRNPGRIIGQVLLAFAGEHAGKRARIIGEPIWAGRDATEYPACAQHEALINPAFDGLNAIILCPYNTSELEPQVVADALRTHPVVWTSTEQYPSDQYVDPLVTAESFNVPLSPRPPTAEHTIIDVENAHLTIAETRRFSASFALAVGLPVERVADAVLTVDELVANTLDHGGGRGQLAAWTEHGRAVFEVTNGSHITDPLVGRRPVRDDQATGRGLSLVHRRADLVRMHTNPRGTTIRAYLVLTQDLDQGAI